MKPMISRNTAYENPRVLVVDDEPSILSSLARMLRMESFECEFVTNADEALRLMMVEPFDVVVSDCQMPVMDGITLLRRVREISPATTRILLTGYADTGMAVKAINQGEVFRFLTKPWQPDEFLLALEQGVARYREAMAALQAEESGNTNATDSDIVEGDVVVRVLPQEEAPPIMAPTAESGSWEEVLGPILFSSREFYRRFNQPAQSPASPEETPTTLRRRYEEITVLPEELVAGMVASRDVCLDDGTCLLRRNTVLRAEQMLGIRAILAEESDPPPVYIYRQIVFDRLVS